MTALVVLLLFAAAVAWWGARRAGDPAGYFAAGHSGGAWLVGVAGTAAALSAFTFVGGPGLFSVVGVGSLWILLSAPLTGALQCWAVGEPVVGLVRRHGVVTVPGLLRAQLGSPAAQGAAAVVIALGCVASLAVQARAAAVLGRVFLGVDEAAAAGAVMAATTLYVALGGMRAGLLADAVQGAVMAVAAVVLAVAALALVGGPEGATVVLERARPELLGGFGRTRPADAFALFLLFCVGTCAQPHYVQKFLFLRARHHLRILPAVLTLALAVTLTVWIGVGLAGTALAAEGRLTLGAPDDLAPRTMALVGPWAVVLAGVASLAALMSTAASFLNLAAAALTRDAFEALGRAPRGLGAARLVTVVVAAAATAVGAGSDTAVAILGIIGWRFFTAALLPALTLGLAWPRATARGAVAAIVAGAAIDLALEAITPQLPAGLDPGLAGAAAGFLVMVALARR